MNTEVVIPIQRRLAIFQNCFIVTAPTARTVAIQLKIKGIEN